MAVSQTHLSKNKQLKQLVVVLAGIDLIFFTRATMGLHFGFMLKTVLIIHL